MERGRSYLVAVVVWEVEEVVVAMVEGRRSKVEVEVAKYLMSELTPKVEKRGGW